MIYGTGCIKSKLDGTEHKYSAGKMTLPEEFSYVGVMPPVLNQGATSKCVCYSLTAYMDWFKNENEDDNNGGQFNIDELYSIRADKNANGMQIKEALKYLKHHGLNGYKINEYAMVGSEIALKKALIANGPCAAGLPVYTENQYNAFWDGNTFAGGHCILIVGYNKEGFIIRNSWGRNWADHGYITLPYSKFGKIFEAWTIM